MRAKILADNIRDYDKVKAIVFSQYQLSGLTKHSAGSCMAITTSRATTRGWNRRTRLLHKHGIL